MPKLSVYFICGTKALLDKIMLGGCQVRTAMAINTKLSELEKGGHKHLERVKKTQRQSVQLSCLRCGKQFKSWCRRRNRICSDCKESEDWCCAGFNEEMSVIS